MPYPKKTYRRKRSYRRRPKKYALTKTVRQRGMLANSQIVKMRYAQAVNLDAIAGSQNSWVFRANSIHDPDLTGGGHQPLGHDEWENFYYKYKVLKSKLTATFAVSTGAVIATQHAVCSARLSETSVTTATNYTDMIENQRSAYGVFRAYGQKPIKLTRGYNAAKHFPIAKTDEQIAADFGASPVEQAYYHVTVASTNSAVNPDPVEVVVLIEYTVLMTQPKDLVRST